MSSVLLLFDQPGHLLEHANHDLQRATVRDDEGEHGAVLGAGVHRDARFTLDAVAPDGVVPPALLAAMAAGERDLHHFDLTWPGHTCSSARRAAGRRQPCTHRECTDRDGGAPWYRS